MSTAEQNSRPLGSAAWQAHVKASEQSGLSRAEYCRQYNLSYHALTYWCKKRLSETSSANRKKISLVPVPLPLSVHKESLSTAGSGVQLKLPGQITVDLAPDFSADTLVKVLALLESR